MKTNESKCFKARSLSGSSYLARFTDTLEEINLYDEDGDFVAEFSSEEELQDFFSKVQPNGCCWEV